MSIVLSPHFQERFQQRVAKTKRMRFFTEQAFFFGKTVQELNDHEFANSLRKREREANSAARIYKNAVYWFHGNKAITVYPVPQKVHKRL